MPLPFAGPLLTAGAGSTIPIAGGAATSGDTGPILTDINLAPVRIGGVLQKGGVDGNGTNLVPIIALAGVGILAFFMFRMRR